MPRPMPATPDALGGYLFLRPPLSSMVRGFITRRAGRVGVGRLDVVACFAGHPFRAEEWYKDYAALTPDEVRAPIDIDLLGSIFVTQAALPGMVKARRGSVILVGSTPALTGDTVGIPYLVAK